MLCDEELFERENPDESGPKCTCPNADNPHHRCMPFCKEHMGCNGTCGQKKRDQKRPSAEVKIAHYGPLIGRCQTTPRAELHAILVAVRFGISPQVIVSDHINHVIYLDRWMYEGWTGFLSPMTPNLDLWRKIYDAVNSRGGLKPDGDDQLSFRWQPSHTRAHRGETKEQRFLRRGNDAADIFANLGRTMHKNIAEHIAEVKKA